MTSISPKRKLSKAHVSIESAKKQLTSNGQSLDGVFLGGACNPTTWRKDIAIPFLEANRIPYFNPQVDEWYPELIGLEAAAKEQASCLLFVFQPHLTRGLVSLVEVAHLATQPYPRLSRHRRHPRFLLVVRPPPPSIFSSARSCVYSPERFVTSMEAASIEAAYRWLEGLQFPHVRFFEQLEDALRFINTLYHQNISRSQRLSTSSTKRRLKRLQKSSGFSQLADNVQRLTSDRLLRTYQYSSLDRKITPGLKFDLYCGGAPPKTITGSSRLEVERGGLNWVIPRQNTQRDFVLSMAVQSHCSRLYFHISRQDFWIVEQMEAAFAIGCGKEVVLCVEYLNDDDITGRAEGETRSERSSGYSSLASTPDEAHQLLKGTISSSASRSASTSEYEETVTLKDESRLEDISQAVVSEKGVLKTNEGNIGNRVARSLSSAAIKDHNRSRSYLISLLEGTAGAGKGLLLARPAEDIKDLLLLML